MAYQPSTDVPSDLQALRSWLINELGLISASLSNPDVVAVFFTELNAPPERIYETQTVFADGTNWNPGAGRGLYCRITGAWVKL